MHEWESSLLAIPSQLVMMLVQPVNTDWGTENRRNSALGRLPETWLKIHYSGADGENVDIDAAVRIIYSISTAPRVYPVYIGVER